MNSRHILLVDDSNIVRMVIAKQLEKLGFVTALADDGQIAVDAVREKAFDLIFMDVMMPNMDGMEATKQIRQLEQEAGRKPSIIIGVTGYTNRAECFAAGMDDFMFKPVTIEQLRSAINQWLPDSQLPTTANQPHLFADQDGRSETSDATAKRIDDLKLRLGFKSQNVDD
jgi:CheY-like chemotaxis protein